MLPPSSGSKNYPSKKQAWEQVESRTLRWYWFLAWLLPPWIWRRYVTPKLRLTSSALHGRCIPEDSKTLHNHWCHNSRVLHATIFTQQNTILMVNGFCRLCCRLREALLLSLFYTTCFGLYGHLQVCSMLLLSCSWRNLLRWSFCILHVVTLLYVSICVFLFYFSVLFAVSCVRVYLLVFSCCLSVV
jgi:hypothetical protein